MLSISIKLSRLFMTLLRLLLLEAYILSLKKVPGFKSMTLSPASYDCSPFSHLTAAPGHRSQLCDNSTGTSLLQTALIPNRNFVAKAILRQYF